MFTESPPKNAANPFDFYFYLKCIRSTKLHFIYGLWSRRPDLLSHVMCKSAISCTRSNHDCERLSKIEGSSRLLIDLEFQLKSFFFLHFLGNFLNKNFFSPSLAFAAGSQSILFVSLMPFPTQSHFQKLWSAVNRKKSFFWEIVCLIDCKVVIPRFVFIHRTGLDNISILPSLSLSLTSTKK